MLALDALPRDHPQVPILVALTNDLVAALFLAAIVVLVGATSFHFLIWRKTALPLGPVRDATNEQMFAMVVQWGVWSAAALVLLAGPRAAGVAALLDDRFSLGSRMAALLFRSEWGIGFGTTLVAGVLALAGYLLVKFHRNFGWALVVLSVPALGIGCGLMGHPFDAFATLTAAPIFDGLHALGVGAWLGSFFFLILAERRVHAHTASPWTDPLGAMIERYFRASGALATAVLLTGLFSSATHLTGFDDISGTQYGRLLAGKVGIVCILMVFNEFLRRHAERQARTTERPQLVRTLRFQAALILLVMALTALLVDVPPPGVNEVRGDVFHSASRDAVNTAIP